jgi:hypothetical protein
MQGDSGSEESWSYVSEEVPYALTEPDKKSAVTIL